MDVFPDQLNEDLAMRIGRAFAAHLKPRQVVVGRDIRSSSEALCQALAEGFACRRGRGAGILGFAVPKRFIFATFSEGGVLVASW